MARRLETRGGRRRIVEESRIAREPLRLAVASRGLRRRTPAPAWVVVLPGLGAHDVSTIPLRWYLQRVGHHVEGWELGVHGTDVSDTLLRFIRRLERAVDIAGEPVVLVGWSLGGVIAREAARDRPDLVRQVITFGSPINGFHGAARTRRPIRVPITTIYSRRDGVVDWRDAVDERSPSAINVEVESSHLGLGIDPDVWRTIADSIDGLTSSARRT